MIKDRQEMKKQQNLKKYRKVKGSIPRESTTAPIKNKKDRK